MAIQGTRDVDGEVYALGSRDPPLLPVVVEGELGALRQDVGKLSQENPQLVERDLDPRSPPASVGHGKLGLWELDSELGEA